MAERDTPSRHGDAEFTAAYRSHLPTILRYLRRRLGDDAAEDAASEVFIRALTSTSRRSEGPEAVVFWLYGIAGNVISERRRTETRRLKALERLASQTPTSAPPAAGPFELDPAVMRRLRAMPAAEREALLLMAWGDLTYEQIAIATSVPIGTVRSRIARGRKRLEGVTTHDTTSASRSATALDPNA